MVVVMTVASLRSSRAVASDNAVQHHTAGNQAAATYTKHLPHLGMTGDHFFEDRIQHSGKRPFHIFDQIVDYLIVSDFDAGLFCAHEGGLVDIYTEPDDDRLTGFGEHDVRLGNVTHSRLHDLDFDLIVFKLFEAVDDWGQRTLRIGPQNNVEGFGFAAFDTGEHVLQRHGQM